MRWDQSSSASHAVTNHNRRPLDDVEIQAAAGRRQRCRSVKTSAKSPASETKTVGQAVLSSILARFCHANCPAGVIGKPMGSRMAPWAALRRALGLAFQCWPVLAVVGRCWPLLPTCWQIGALGRTSARAGAQQGRWGLWLQKRAPPTWFSHKKNRARPQRKMEAVRRFADRLPWDIEALGEFALTARHPLSR